MAKMLKTSARGRKCMFPLCKQVLSIYNHRDYCHVHLHQMPKEQKNSDTVTPPDVPTGTA